MHFAQEIKTRSSERQGGSARRVCCYRPATLSSRVLRANKLAVPLGEAGCSVARISERPAILPLRAPVSGRAKEQVVNRTSTVDSNTFKTGLHCSAPVESIGPGKEKIPLYTLRGDAAAALTGYQNQSWYIPPPSQRLPPITDDLTPEQTKETLNYFLLCGERVSQMTKTYNDVEAVTRLLEEKEKDLELAARIGQGLLTRNKALEERLVAVEGELTSAHDSVTQLRHDLLLKGELLQIYSNDFDDNSPEGVRAFTTDLLQRKVKGLEDDNRKLRAEASQLADESSETEVREEQLLHQVVAQLAEANNHIKNLDEELANKYDETNKHREEITSLLGQLVSQRHKIRELTLENEDLTMQLHVVRECQNELAVELSEYKDKYAEILDLLHETQEQVKEQNKRSLPTSRGLAGASAPPSRAASHYHPDSLASELELSSLGSESWPSEISSLPQIAPSRFQYQRVFDTVRCASMAVEPGVLASTPTTDGPRMPPRLVVNTSTPIAQISPSFQKAQSVLEKLTATSETDYPATSKVGVPGTPGTVDLTHALRRLAPKTTATGPSHDGHGWRTPDSMMSTGSRSGLSSLNSFQYPEKLKIIKPMEGSMTLHHWSRLATPHLGTLLEERPGVATRETKSQHTDTFKYQRDFLEMYSLFDVEEDEDMETLPGKTFDSSAPVYTLTNSTAIHPNNLTRVTSSMQSAYMTSSVDFPSLNHSVNSIEPMLSGNRSDPLSTSCTQRSLVEALHERGVGHSIVGWSGLSTPNNSPGCSSPDESSTHFLYETWEFLAEGAKMLRRTLTGEETPLPPARCLLPRIARRELETVSQMHLLDKLEKLGLDEVNQSCSSVSPTTLRVALENLTYVNNGRRDDSDAWKTNKDGNPTFLESRSPIRRNLSNSSVENMSSPKLSPMHRSSSVGLNMICDLGSPSSIASNFDIRAKFQVV